MNRIKHFIRWILCLGLYYGGILAVIRRLKEKKSGFRSIVLRYHRVHDEARRDPFHLSVTPESFTAQMRFLKKHYRIVRPEEVLNQTGTGSNTAGTDLVITFDDGYRDNFEHALPVLRQEAVPAVIFVTGNLVNTINRFWWDEMEQLITRTRKATVIVNWQDAFGRDYHEIMDISAAAGKISTLERLERIGNEVTDFQKTQILQSLKRQLGEKSESESRRDLMTWEEVRALHRDGIQIGSHGLTHRLLTRIPQAEADYEITGSKTFIERELGSAISMIAFPGGKTSEAVWKCAQGAGYKAAFSTEAGENIAGTNPFCLKRRAVHEQISVNPWGEFSEAMFAASVEGLFERTQKEKKIRILYAIDKLTRAGSQRHLSQVLKRLDREVFEPEVVCMESGGPLEEELRDLKIPVHILGIPNWHTAAAFKGIGRLFGLMLKIRPQMVHCYLFTANVFVPPVAKLCGVPAVITSRRDLGDWKSHRQISMSRISNLFTDLVFVNSDAVGKSVVELEGVDAARIHRIYNGIETRENSPPSRSEVLRQFNLPEKRLYAGTVSNIREEKDPEVLIRAFIKTAKKFPDLDLIYAGRVKDEALMGRLEALLRQEGFTSRVHFIGSVDRVRDLLSVLEFFVFTSKSEGFSNAILEAMEARRAVIATRVGGNREQVTDNETGILVAKGDWQQCSDAMADLMRDALRRRSMGQKGYEKLLRMFHVTQMMCQFYEMYRRTLRAKGVEVPPTHEELQQRIERELHESTPVHQNTTVA